MVYYTYSDDGNGESYNVSGVQHHLKDNCHHVGYHINTYTLVTKPDIATNRHRHTCMDAHRGMYAHT